MKVIYLLLVLYLTSFIVVHSASTTISFETAGSGYAISGNAVTINSEGTYELSDVNNNKKIIISSSCTLNLNSFTLINTDTLTPILISANKVVEFVLSGESTLKDSSTNENEGVIYLQNGASLTISGTGTLNINPTTYMAINGTQGTSLIVNDGANIRVQSESTTVGGIYLRNGITFNNAVYIYDCPNGKNHSIDSEGTIKLIKGKYSLNSGNGKGIQSEKDLYIGEEGGNDDDLLLSIITTNEGIEAMGITFYSGSISIDATEDGINAAAQGTECDAQCSGNCVCYITFKGGKLNLTSGEDGIDSNGDITITGGQIIVFASITTEDQPIDQDGLLNITGGAIIAAGTSSMGGVSGETTQVAKVYTGTINAGDKLEVTDTNGNKIININTTKAASYIYFNYKTSFIVKLNNVQVTLSEPSQGQQPGGGPGQGGMNDPNSSDRQPFGPNDPNSSDRPGFDPNSSDRQPTPSMNGNPSDSTVGQEKDGGFEILLKLSNILILLGLIFL